MSNVVSMANAPRDIPTMTAVGDRLARTREALGLTQEELAAEIGVARNTLSGYESGTRLADVLAMMRLHQRRRIPLDWIFAGDPSSLPKHVADKLFAAETSKNPMVARGRVS